MMKLPLLVLAGLALGGAARGAGTQAVSREASFYILPRPGTLAVSREASFFVPTAKTQSVSREATFFVNYRLEDIARALRIAAGLTAAGAEDKALLNVAAGPSASVVDVLDAAKISRYVMDPTLLP